MIGEERIDPGDVGFDERARLRVEPGPGLARRARQADGAQEPIGYQPGLADDLGEAAIGDAPLELHLPEAFLCVHVAESEERIRFGGRPDVRHLIDVTHNLDAAAQAVDPDRAGRVGQRCPKAPEEQGNGHRDDRDEAKDDAPQPPARRPGRRSD